MNAEINPKFNASINPKSNANINPVFNANINPKFNASINPKFNANINYKFNASINPSFNSSINPLYNYSINPLMNSAFDGPFIYDLAMDPTGFIIRTNDEVILLFDKHGKFNGVGARNAVGGYTIFSLDNEWIGQFIPTPSRIMLWFGAENEWLGTVV